MWLLKNHRVYAFTNENVTSYQKIYHFDGANVLSVLGSGDQYFSSVLYGAKKIDLYDSNPNTYPFFVLKFYCLKYLSKEEFKSLYLTKDKKNKEILEKVFSHLPSFIQEQLSFLSQEQLVDYLLYSIISKHQENYQTGRIIPYFEDNYYEILQEKLKYRKLPLIYLKNLLTLESDIKKGNYQLLLTSNIYDWISLNPREYQAFLEKLMVDEIQAYYGFNGLYKEKDQFKSLGMDITKVPASSTKGVNEVYTLRK